MNFISLGLQDDVITNISDFPSGPRAFVEIIQIKVKVDVLGVRKLEKDLQALSIAKQPAENVQEFNKRVIPIATKLKNCNSTSDLNTLVATLYVDSSVELFHSEALKISNECNKDLGTTKWPWKNILSEHLKTYDALKARDI